MQNLRPITRDGAINSRQLSSIGFPRSVFQNETSCFDSFDSPVAGNEPTLHRLSSLFVTPRRRAQVVKTLIYLLRDKNARMRWRIF